MKKFKVDVEEMPEEIEAKDLNEAFKIASLYLGLIECD